MPGIGEVNQVTPDVTYDAVPRSERARMADSNLERVREWLDTLERPPGIAEDAYTRFVRYAQRFFVQGDKLWKKDAQGKHRVVLSEDRRVAVMKQAHDELGHRGNYATLSHIATRF